MLIYYTGKVNFFGAELLVEDVEIEVTGEYLPSSDSYEYGSYDTSVVRLESLQLAHSGASLDLKKCHRDLIKKAEYEIFRDWEASN